MSQARPSRGEVLINAGHSLQDGICFEVVIRSRVKPELLVYGSISFKHKVNQSDQVQALAGTLSTYLQEQFADTVDTEQTMARARELYTKVRPRVRSLNRRSVRLGKKA